MNPGETKIGYIERCIVQEQQGSGTYDIKKFPESCLERDDCVFDTICEEGTSDCINVGDVEFEGSDNSDWDLVDTCKGKSVGQFSELKQYLGTLIPVPVQSPRRSRRF